MSLLDQQNEFLVRPIRTSEDFDFIIAFRKELNWKIGKHVLQLMMKIDPDGALVAEKLETGKNYFYRKISSINEKNCRKFFSPTR